MFFDALHGDFVVLRRFQEKFMVSFGVSGQSCGKTSVLGGKAGVFSISYLLLLHIYGL